MSGKRGLGADATLSRSASTGAEEGLRDSWPARLPGAPGPELSDDALTSHQPCSADHAGMKTQAVGLNEPVVMRGLLVKLFKHSDLGGFDRRGRRVLLIQTAAMPLLLLDELRVFAEDGDLKEDDPEEEDDRAERWDVRAHEPPVAHDPSPALPAEIATGLLPDLRTAALPAARCCPAATEFDW